MMRCKLCFVAFLLMLLIPVLSHARDAQAVPLTTFHEVADYIKKYNSLPDNFITKQEAKNHGWNPARHNLWDVAPGKSIGGDRFFNREKKLQDKRGRIWYEADINYKGGKRGKDRIIFSNDGLIYKTEDHYRTFKRME